MGIDMAKISIKEARERVKIKSKKVEQAEELITVWFKKIEKIENELSEKEINIDDAVNKYIEEVGENDPDSIVPPEIQAKFKDFKKTEALVNYRDSTMALHRHKIKMERELMTEMEAILTLVKKYPKLRGGRKTRKRKTKKKRKKKRKRRKKKKTKRRR